MYKYAYLWPPYILIFQTKNGTFECEITADKANHIKTYKGVGESMLDAFKNCEYMYKQPDTIWLRTRWMGWG